MPKRIGVETEDPILRNLLETYYHLAHQNPGRIEKLYYSDEIDTINTEGMVAQEAAHMNDAGLDNRLKEEVNDAAEYLVGSVLRFGDNAAIITDARAWTSGEGFFDAVAFKLLAGTVTIGKYERRRIPAISAHKDGGVGVVTIHAVQTLENRLLHETIGHPERIVSEYGFEGMVGHSVLFSHGAGTVVQVRNPGRPIRIAGETYLSVKMDSGSGPEQDHYQLMKE